MAFSTRSLLALRHMALPLGRPTSAYSGLRFISISPVRGYNYDEEHRGGHPEHSFHLRYTDPQPIQEHARDVRLKLRKENTETTGPRPDKLYKTIALEILGYETATLDSYEWFLLAAASHLGITVGKRWSPPKYSKQRFNLLRSVFVHKKHQVHYEVRTYHRFVNLHKMTGSTADTFLEYIQRNLPEGIGLKVTKFEVMKIPDYITREEESSTGGEAPASIEVGK